MNNIILTSNGLSEKIISDILTPFLINNEKATVQIITTASRGKSRNKFCKLAYRQFKDAGYANIRFIDLEKKELTIEKKSVVYISGGNALKLQKAAKNSSLERHLKMILSQGGLCIGVSAGSMILGPYIGISKEVGLETSEIKLLKHHSLGLIKETVFPHYTRDCETKIRLFEKTFKIKVIRLEDGSHVKKKFNIKRDHS